MTNTPQVLRNGEKTPAEILLKAKTLLLEKGWCQGGLARDKFGKGIHFRNVEAESYCALGAMYLAESDQRFSVGDSAMANLYKACLREAGHESVATFNDSVSTTKERVLKLFDLAIQLANGVEGV